MVPMLLAGLPALLEEVRQLLSPTWPEYAQFMADERDAVLAAGQAFMRRLVHIAGRGPDQLPPDSPPPEVRAQLALFEEVGRAQFRQGHDVSVLLAAYQVGARAAWHFVAGTALTARVAPEALVALAEAVFVFIDQLSSASAHGFVAEQAEASAARDRLRDELVELLLSDRADLGAVRAAAGRLGWRLPAQACVLLIEPTNPVGQAILSRLDPAHLLVRRAGTPIGAILSGPVRPASRTELSAALRGTGAVIGHPVGLTHLPLSAHIAEVAAELKTAGVLTDDPVFAEDHLDAIIVHRDPRLLEALRRQTLAPLQDLTLAAQERLSETLASWLRHMGDRQAIAAELHIHPQTVRYRTAQLHELFGANLDDPDYRARLVLALGWQKPVGRPAKASAPRRRLGDAG